MDRAEALPVGRGQFDLFGFLRGDATRGVVGGQAEYRHHVSPWAVLFGQAWGGVEYGYGPLRASYGGLFGVRLRW